MNKMQEKSLINAINNLINTLDSIYRANETQNNGAVMGEAVLCSQFSHMAKYAIEEGRAALIAAN